MMLVYYIFLSLLGKSGSFANVNTAVFYFPWVMSNWVQESATDKEENPTIFLLGVDQQSSLKDVCEHSITKVPAVF